MVEREWANPEFQRIVVESLVPKLGRAPHPFAIAQYLAECEFERYQSRGPELLIVDETLMEQLTNERMGPAY